jgi:hypothetical protein
MRELVRNSVQPKLRWLMHPHAPPKTCCLSYQCPWSHLWFAIPSHSLWQEVETSLRFADLIPVMHWCTDLLWCVIRGLPGEEGCGEISGTVRWSANSHRMTWLHIPLAFNVDSVLSWLRDLNLDIGCLSDLQGIHQNDATGLMPEGFFLNGFLLKPPQMTGTLELGGPQIPDILCNVVHQWMLVCISATRTLN